MKTNWKKGLPNISGLYWLDSGSHLSKKDNLPAALIKVKSDQKIESYGASGSFPLDVYIGTKALANAKWAEIKRPEEWVSGDEIKKDCMAWIKHPEGYLGIVFLKVSYGLHGEIIWKNHPDCGAYYGFLFTKEKEQYLFSIIKRVKKDD